VLQELAMKLRAEGRTYNSETFNRKKRKAAGKADGQGRPKKKVKVKSSQRNKAPYNVSNHAGGGQEPVEQVPAAAASAGCTAGLLQLGQKLLD
jgi:hypothetical protein